MQVCCYVCESKMLPFFNKDFHGAFGLSVVEYWKCSRCGFVISKTHADMKPEEWEQLNFEVHASYQGSDFVADDPKWLTRLNSQSAIIQKLANDGIIPSSLPWVDYACGDGKLSDLLFDKGYATHKFDRYMNHGNADYLSCQDLFNNKYGNVISTSSFEHFLSITPVEEIMSLVDQSGVLSLHTLVREEVPCDPAWFYLLPVHVAFHTNRSMQVIFDKFGFKASIYHLPSTMWFWFRENIDFVQEYTETYNRHESDILFFKRGFMDYWKN